MEEVIVRTQRIAILANLLAHLWVSLEQDSQVNTLIRAGDPVMRAPLLVADPPSLGDYDTLSLSLSLSLSLKPDLKIGNIKEDVKERILRMCAVRREEGVPRDLRRKAQTRLTAWKTTIIAGDGHLNWCTPSVQQ